MIDLTNLIMAAILVAVAVIAYKLLPWMQTEIGKEKTDRILFWVRIAVYAMEQTIKGEHMGAERKAKVKAFLNKLGYDADLDTIDSMIEAEVLKLKLKLTE